MNRMLSSITYLLPLTHRWLATAGAQLTVRLVKEDQHCKDRHVKAKGRRLAVPRGRLPHRKPLTANDHKTEKPHEKPKCRADDHEALCMVEADAVRAQTPGKRDSRNRQDNAGQPLAHDDQRIACLP